MRKRASELEPGDKIIRGPWRGGLEGRTVRTVETHLYVKTTDGRAFRHDPDAGFDVEEPHIPMQVPESLAEKVLHGDPHAITRLCRLLDLAVQSAQK